MNYSSFKRGILGGFLAIMLAVTAVPIPQAEAATLEELQAQLVELIAQLNALQNNTTSVCLPFTADLTIGRTGPDVTRLQSFLITRGQSIPAGATGYFGGQTRAAVASFQAQHGIQPSVGYFGPLTRAKVNSLCTVTVPTQPGDTNGGGTSSGSGSELKGDEATIDRFEAKSGDDTNLEEGQKEASVMDIEFRVREGDIRVDRLDLAFVPDALNNENDPWDTFDEVSLWSGSKRIARIDAGDEDNWDEDSPSNGEYRLRMSSLKWIVEEDDTAELTVKMTLQNNIKGTNDGEVWNVFVPTDGIRAVDSTRSTLYVGDSADQVSFDIDQAGSDDELIVKRSDEDPDSTTLELERNSQSGWLTVFAFDLDTDDSTNDIDIRKLPVELTVGTSTTATFIRDVRVTIDGTSYTKMTVTDGTTGTYRFDFKRGEMSIDAGDRVIVKVEARFKSLPEMYEGTTIVGSVNTSGIEAEGADDLTGSQISGSATGETHALRTSGAIIKAQSTSATFKANSADTTSDDEGSFAVKFDVTAFNTDIYIAKSAERGTTLGTQGVNFTIEDASAGGIETASGTVAAALSSNATSEGGFYRVREGETKSFTLLVEYDPEFQSFFNVQLYSLNWSTAAVDPTVQQRAVPESNYETTVLSIGN